jgi:hypothetical protein
LMAFVWVAVSVRGRGRSRRSVTKSAIHKPGSSVRAHCELRLRRIGKLGAGWRTLRRSQSNAGDEKGEYGEKAKWSHGKD